MAQPMKLVWKDQRLEYCIIDATGEAQMIRIGRNRQNDVVIPDPLVSGTHAIIRDGTLIDKKSTNGTFINGVEVPKNQPMPLKDKDKIKFGDTEVLITAGTPYSNDAEDASSGSSDSSDDESNDSVPDLAMPTQPAGGDDKGGPDWARNAPVANGAPAPGGDDQIDTLRRENFTLRQNNQSIREQLMNLKKLNNPQRKRMEQRQQQKKESEMRQKIMDLEHQIYYGEEKKDEELDDLRRRVRDLERLEKENQTLQGKIEMSNKQLVSEQRANAELTTKIDVMIDRAKQALRDLDFREESSRQLTGMQQQLNTLTTVVIMFLIAIIFGVVSGGVFLSLPRA